jgi:hypothetical protein
MLCVAPLSRLPGNISQKIIQLLYQLHVNRDEQMKLERCGISFTILKTWDWILREMHVIDGETSRTASNSEAVSAISITDRIGTILLSL